MITGASSGLGEAYARALAARGCDLLVAARRDDRLRALADDVASRHGAATRIVRADLATEAGRAGLRTALDGAGVAPRVLVLNAGFGTRGPLWRLPREREVEMTMLNCTAVVDLAAHALPAMVAAGRGALVVVSSAAAFQPVPHMATYAATKAFELRFAEALGEELRGSGVRVIAVCPGPTRTEFTTGAAPGTSGGTLRWPVPMDDPERVVAATWRALARGRRRVPTGVVAHAAALAAAALPGGLVLRASGLAHRRGGREERGDAAA